MRQYIAFSLVAIVLSTTHALADCQTSLAAALEATRAAEPMQSKMQHFMAGQLTTNIVSEFSPPDQIRQTVTNIKTKLEAVVTGAGKTAWVVLAMNGKTQPAIAFDSSEYMKAAANGWLPDFQVASCDGSDAETQNFIWEDSFGGQTLKIIAQSDAKTHILKSLHALGSGADGAVIFEGKATYAPIAAFTIVPPIYAIESDSGTPSAMHPYVLSKISRN